MSRDRVPHARWLQGNMEFSVRQRVLPKAVWVRAKQPTGVERFEWSHAWPLRWGGPEVTDGVFLAHRHINQSVISRIEGRVANAARELAPHGYEVWVTVAASRYGEVKVLEHASYSIDVFDPAGHRVPGASFEITVPQELTLAQRHGLAAGRDVHIDLHRLTRAEVDLVGLDNLDQMVELARTVRPRKGPFTPAQRHDVVPARERGVHPDSRGTGNNGATDVGRPPTKPTQYADAPEPHGSSANRAVRAIEDVPVSAAKRGRLAGVGKRVARGLVELLTPEPSDVVDLAMAVILGPLESELAAVHAEQLDRSFRAIVSPNVTRVLRTQWPALVANPNTPVRTRPIYLRFRWYAVNTEVAEDAADVVVWFVRFAATNPGFVEVFDHTEVDRVFSYDFYAGPPPRVKDEERKVRTIGTDRFFVYRHFSAMLVADPAVLGFVERLADGRDEVARLGEEASTRMLALDPSQAATGGLPLGLGLMLHNGAYAEASEDLDRLLVEVQRRHGAAAEAVVDALAAMSGECRVLAAELARRYSALGAEQRALLKAHVPGYPVEIPSTPEEFRLLLDTAP